MDDQVDDLGAQFVMPGELDPSGQLAWLIGRVCIEDVRLELAWRYAYMALTGPGLGVVLVPGDLSRIVTDCRTMLGHAGLPADVAMEVKDIAEESNRAHALRNRLVHDLWQHGDGGWSAIRWRRGRLEGVPEIEGFGAEEFLAGLRTLRRTWLRAWALPSVIQSTIPRLGIPVVPDDAADHRRQLRGEFAILPDGGIRLHRQG